MRNSLQHSTESAPCQSWPPLAIRLACCRQQVDVAVSAVDGNTHDLDLACCRAVKEQVNQALKGLDLRPRNILRYRYGLHQLANGPLTLNQVPVLLMICGTIPSNTSVLHCAPAACMILVQIGPLSGLKPYMLALSHAGFDFILPVGRRAVWVEGRACAADRGPGDVHAEGRAHRTGEAAGETAGVMRRQFVLVACWLPRQWLMKPTMGTAAPSVVGYRICYCWDTLRVAVVCTSLHALQALHTQVPLILRGPGIGLRMRCLYHLVPQLQIDLMLPVFKRHLVSTRHDPETKTPNVSIWISRCSKHTAFHICCEFASAVPCQSYRWKCRMVSNSSSSHRVNTARPGPEDRKRRQDRCTGTADKRQWPVRVRDRGPFRPRAVISWRMPARE